MDGEAASHVKFFHLSSRLNRLRYFSYSTVMGWVSMPITMVSIFYTLHHSMLLGGLLNLVGDVFFIPIQFTLMVRRLHDLDRSGWWSLIYATLLPYFIIAALGFKRPAFTGVLLLLALVNFGFALMLLFSRGTPGENRFGPEPPPNTGLVIAGAWSAIPLFLCFIIFEVAMVASLVGTNPAPRGNYAVTIARMGAEQARLYREENHEWPTDLANFAGGELTRDRPYRISTIKYPDGSFGIVVTNTGSLTNGQAVEVWTADGESWHCGPAYSSPTPKESLPPDCQDEPPAIP